VLSLLLNVILISLFVHGYRMPDFKPEHTSPDEKLKIEHIPRLTPAVVKVATAPAPRSHAAASASVALPIPKPLPVVIPHHTLVAPPIAPKPLPHPKYRRVYEPRVVASLQQPPSKPAVTHASPHRFSAQQLADIQSDLGASIAHDRDRENPLAGTATSTQPTMKHYGMDVSTLTAGGVNHHGLCSPVKSWFEDGWDYYYLTCNVRASDGTYDVESIPWPVRYRPSADPNNGTGPDNAPIAMPLPGWHLTPGTYVADGVRQYALEHGVSL